MDTMCRWQEKWNLKLLVNKKEIEYKISYVFLNYWIRILGESALKIEYFWSLVATCIVSAGGVGGIITAVIKFSSDFIAEKVASRYEYKLEKAL